MARTLLRTTKSSPFTIMSHSIHHSKTEVEGDLEAPTMEQVPDTESIAKVGEKDTEKFPEGGEGWLVVAGTWILSNVSYGMVNAFGVYVNYYEGRFPETKSSVISLVGALQPAIIYVSAIPVFALVHIFGPQYVIRAGSLILVFSFMMLSLCKEIWQIYLCQGVLFGIGASMAYLPAVSVPSEWFKEKRALALGIVNSGSSCGGIFWPIAVRRLIDEVGFGWTNRIIGFIYLGILIFSGIVVKPRFKAAHIDKLMDLTVVKDWRFCLLLLANFISMFGLFPPFFYIESYVARLNMKPIVSNYIITYLNAASVIGRLVPGYLGDIFGRTNVLIPFVLGAGIFPLVLWLPSTSYQMIVAFAIMQGICTGAFVAQYPAVVGQIFGIKGMRSRLGIFFTLSMPGSLAGPPIAGHWLSDDPHSIHGFDSLIIFSGLMMLVGGILLLVVRLTVSRKLFAFV